MTILDRAVTEVLLAQPETGMGYQIVEVLIRKALGEAEREHLLVFNSEVTGELEGRIRLLRDGASERSKRVVELALIAPTPEASFRALTRNEARNAGFISKTAYAVAEGPASDAPVELSKREEEFLRFSAFPNDRRIKPDGSVLPGTYVTTMVDGMKYVKTGMDAVRRYALPNPAPAVYRFYLRPPDPIPVRRGRVQSAFGQPGGGVEVIFEKGAPARTKYKQDTIPLA